jgi:cation diffusion facilitator family transporter
MQVGAWVRMARVSAERRQHLRIGIGLEVFSILWMLVEGGVGITAGVVARSVSLEAFGIDSALELLSAGIVLWWLLLSDRGADPERTHDAGERAERGVGVGLLALALYVTVGAIYQLVTRGRPETSTAGLILSIVAVLVMPVLFWLKRGNAERLQSQAMRGDAIESLGCAWMACALLVGLALHNAFGWWWADPAAALVLVYFLVREGWEGVCEVFEAHEASADDAE